MTVTYATMVRHYRLNLAWALALRLAALFHLGATVHSALKYWSGSGADWKGRAQDVHDCQTTETPSVRSASRVEQPQRANAAPSLG